MSKIELVRAAMVEAMKAKDKDRKDSLSMLLSALKNAEIDKRSPLTEDEANAVIKKELKQTKETMDTAPADRTDIIEEARKRMEVYQEFAPADLTVDQITEIINGVLRELEIEAPTAKDKGRISTASRLPVALRSSASAKLYQKWSKTPELRGFRGFSFSNGLTQFDRTKPLLTRFLWVKWWTTTPKRGLMG